VRALVDLRSVDDTAVGEQALQRVEPMIVVAPRLLTGVVFLPVVRPSRSRHMSAEPLAA